MKKILLILLITIVTTLSTQNFCCANGSANIIDNIENSIFGVTYTDDTQNIRLSRIEKNIYGNTKNNKSTNQRIIDLKNDLQAELMGQEIEPKEDTFEDEDECFLAEEPKEDDSVKYPVVDSLERVIFKKVNNEDNIKHRLAKLEEKVFNHVYSDSLSSRVDRLKASINPANNLANIEQSENSTYPPEYNNIFGDELSKKKNMEQLQPHYQRNKSVLEDYPLADNINKPLSKLEKSILKKVYKNDSLPNRLTRLETTVFNAEFSQDDPQMRINRLNSAHKAQKSAKKYNGNKFEKHLATAMQIGTMVLMVLACIL